MSFTIKVANFAGRNAGESVAWVTVDTGNCAGAKRGKEGAGINPKLILSILGDDAAKDSPHQAHLREVSLKAIALTQPAPASPLTKKAVATATADMFYVWDGSAVLPLMGRNEAMAHVSNPLALFSVPSDAENWQPAATFGLNVTAPPAPPAAPVQKPEVASAPVADDSQSILDKINAARGQRVLSGK